MPTKTTPTLRVYGQGQCHDPVHIVGTREALIDLHRLLGDTLDGATGTAASLPFFAVDGEGYTVHVTLVRDETAMDGYLDPYVEEITFTRNHSLWPRKGGDGFP